MEEETMDNQTTTNSSMYYILGAVVLVAVIGAGYMLRPKTAAPAAPGEPVATAPKATPTPLGPINRLQCDTQYYNPVIGFPKYYLSVDGADVTGAQYVDCTMTISQENKVVATEKTTAPVVAKPERNGGVFKCSTAALDGFIS